MRFIKRSRVYLITLGLLVFSVGSARGSSGLVEEWSRRYNGPVNYYDGATSVAVDGSGNVYVTGGSYLNPTYMDYATVKYDSDGNQLWVAGYNGPGNTVDIASDIAVDASGNVYVTGRSNAGTYDDYATIKYDTNGSQKWVSRYDGPLHNRDTAVAVAVDGSGNVYVTGQSLGTGTGYDYATVKYNSTGVEQWVRRYHGPVGGGNDYAYDMALDGSGNIYVTGYSAGSGSSWDYATIKYDSAGTQLWVARYNGPANDKDEASDIAVDGSANVYVTGRSVVTGAGYNYVTIKYDTNGSQKWVASYNGLGNDYDGPSDITVDGSGNVFVTGESVGSGTFEDYATVKYDTNGNEIWVARYNGPANDYDRASAIALDGSGYIYVTGQSFISVGDSDYTTIKYDSAGNIQRVRMYNGPADGNDSATDIAIDVFGNIFVVGTSFSVDTWYDYATVKYTQVEPFILTMQTNPPEVDTVTPPVGDNEYAPGVAANIIAQRFVNCPVVYVFDHWIGDVTDPYSANTTIIMDANETVTAVFVDGRQCGDECHPHPVFDFDHDCEVSFGDFAVFAVHWLECTKPECD